MTSQGNRLPVNELPSPTEMFGATARFFANPNSRTAHVFSDIGRGCVYDCEFCSERISVVGAPLDLDGSGKRLAQNLRAAEHTMRSDTPNVAPTAFVEDSTLLAFRPNLVTRFAEEITKTGINMPFGGQATIDQILQRSDLLPILRDCGLNYLFIGIETPNPSEIGGMSKDIGRKRGGWLERAESALELLHSFRIEAGISLLFGLGENEKSVDQLFDAINSWKTSFGFPNTISMNWAVQHPLCGGDDDANYDYCNWPIDDEQFLYPLSHFGEASTIYTMAGQPRPQIEHVTYIVERVLAIKNQTLSKPICTH